MTPARVTAEPQGDANNLATQMIQVLRKTFGLEPKGRGHVYQNHILLITTKYRSLGITVCLNWLSLMVTTVKLLLSM